MDALGIQHLVWFAAAALLLNITPGPDMLFVAGSAAARDGRAGVLAALGVGAGCLLHVMLAAAGISALLAASPATFEVLRWVGAAYLMWAGITLLRARAAPAGDGADKPAASTGRSVFWQGALTNALNPKVALFFLAFLPQFIEPGASHAWLGMLLLGLVFDVSGTLVNLLVAVAVGRARHRIVRAPRIAQALQRVVGGLFVALGLRLLVQR